MASYVTRLIGNYQCPLKCDTLNVGTHEPCVPTFFIMDDGKPLLDNMTSIHLPINALKLFAAFLADINKFRHTIYYGVIAHIDKPPTTVTAEG